MRLEIHLDPDQVHAILAFAFINSGDLLGDLGNTVITVPRNKGETELSLKELISRTTIEGPEARALVRYMIENVAPERFMNWKGLAYELATAGVQQADQRPAEDRIKAADEFASRSMIRTRFI